MTLVHLCLLLVLGAPAPAVPAAPAAPTSTQAQGEAPAAEEDAEARAQWRATVAASRTGEVSPQPVSAFRLRAELRTRDGTQRNDTEVELAYQAPERVCITLAGGKRMGRSGRKARDYWLESGERSVTLEGREYEEDRRQIKSMHAVAQNFLALSDPARLEVARVRWLESPPELPKEVRWATGRLRWLRLESTDFALGEGTDSAQSSHTIDFGLARRGEEQDLPRIAIVRERADQRGGAAPMLLQLEAYRILDGFRVPTHLKVHQLATPWPAETFAPLPAQEIYLLDTSTLRAAFSEDDFRPAAR